MTWRSSPLPPNWPQLRRATLNRDHHRCQIASPECLGHATEVDHIDDPTNHQLTNLRAACAPCHRTHTQAQAAAGRTAQAAQRWHPTEPHPGLKP